MALVAMASGFVFLGYQQVLRSWQAFVLLFLAWPYPAVALQEAVAAPMTAATVLVARGATAFLQLPYSEDGGAFTSHHLAEGDNFSIALTSVCSGSAVTMGFLLQFFFKEQPHITLGLATGFSLLGPFLCIGLYDISRRLERDGTAPLVATLTAWRENQAAIAFYAIILMLLISFGPAEIYKVPLLFANSDNMRQFGHRVQRAGQGDAGSRRQHHHRRLQSPGRHLRGLRRAHALSADRGVTRGQRAHVRSEILQHRSAGVPLMQPVFSNAIQGKAPSMRHPQAGSVLLEALVAILIFRPQGLLGRRS